MSVRRIALARPDVGGPEASAISEVLGTGMLVQGPNVERFEAALRELILPGGHAVAVSNGTAALHVALLAAGVRPGDAVLVPTYSWPATANVVELVGATPLFVDIEAESLGMSGAALSAAIDAGRKQFGERLKLVMPVHAFGCPARMEELLPVAERAGLPIVEDAACAIGATWRGSPAGSIGSIGCFSFHPRKILTTGEGGLVVTRDAAVARTLRALRNHGLDPDAPTPDFILPGFNYRMTDFQAAMGIEQVRRLPELLLVRAELCAAYDEAFAGSAVKPMRAGKDAVPNRQAYVVLVPSRAAREKAAPLLDRSGISTTIGTWHIPLTRYFAGRYGYKRGDFPVSDDVFDRAMTLPLHSGLTPDDVRSIAARLIDALAGRE